MTVQALLADLANAGVKLRLVGADRIEGSAPPGRLSAALRERLARHKPELVDWLADARAGRPAEPGLPTIAPDPDHRYEPFAPSDLQMSFLIGSREGVEHYVRPHQYMEFDLPELDPARFERALNRLLRHHRNDLVVFRDDLTLHTVRDPGPVRVPVTDLRDRSDEDAQAGLEHIRAAMSRREPPIDRWPWLDLHLTRFGDGQGRLHYNHNNIFGDAPSMIRFLDTLMSCYRDPAYPLPEMEISYRDCVLALAELEDSALGAASKRYWCDRMAAWPGPPEVPLAAGADPRQRSMLRRREMFLPAEAWAAIKTRAGTAGLTPTNVLLAAHAEMLCRWSGSRHFLLNNMITHRLPLHPQIGAVLGNFASLYPLEVDWRPDEPFAARGRRLQAQVLSDVEHSYWSGVQVLQTLNQVRRTPGRAVCPFAVGSALFVGKADRPVHSILETPQVMFDCEFWELTDGRLWLVWDIIEEMFPPGLIDAMAQGYRSLLDRLVSDDAAWLTTAFDLLPAAQRAQRDELNRSPAPPPDGLLHDLLRRLAPPLVDRPAVLAADGTVTYGELRRRADRLATQIRRYVAEPGGLVAVALPKGWAQVVAVHATLCAGGAYVPVDPGWPAQRLRYLLSETRAGAVLTSRALAPGLVALGDVPVLTVDSAQPDPAEQPDPAGKPAGTQRPAGPAYVIYTSGSTGRPKGVVLDHRGPLNTIIDINRRFGITCADVLFGVSSLCFDLSVYDIFGALAAGATLVLPDAGQTDPGQWRGLAATHRVTVWNSVPAIMQLFVEAATAAGAQFPALRTVLLSGDWIPVDLPDRIRTVAPHARVISLGGATEASIWSVLFPIDEVDPGWRSIPYGRPLSNQTWHVLDEQGQDAPTWVPGHLYLGGAGLAKGYRGDPDQTRAAFVPHPRTGERIYRTGDRGRYLPSGDIEFLGRSDLQVKIQGFRVEPGEVEHALLAYPGVCSAAVVARASGSGRQLAAFVTGQDLTGLAVREFLTDRLPGYLVPSQVTVLDRLPLTGNGKIDRRALAALGPAEQRRTRTAIAPRTPTEVALVEIWQEVLASGPVSIHDDFFDLGGQSFAALRVAAKVTGQLGRRGSLGTLLERRTVAGLAEWLATPERSWSPLVRLTQSPQGRPWFLVHPAGGNVLCYQHLAGLLDGSVHAFQAPGPATGHQPLSTIEDLAEQYLPALREVQPDGPYRLGGWSSGAIVAFELAHRLEAGGQIVEQVAVIDAPAPHTPREIDDAALLLWFLEDLEVSLGPDEIGADEAGRLATLPTEQAVAAAVELARRHGAAGLDPADLVSALAVFRGVVRASNAYRPPRIAADITVLRAAHGVVSEFADHPEANSPGWGWASLTTGVVCTATVPGTHHTLLAAEHVAALADVINRSA